MSRRNSGSCHCVTIRRIAVVLINYRNSRRHQMNQGFCNYQTSPWLLGPIRIIEGPGAEIPWHHSAFSNANLRNGMNETKPGSHATCSIFQGRMATMQRWSNPEYCTSKETDGAILRFDESRLLLTLFTRDGNRTESPWYVWELHCTLETETCPIACERRGGFRTGQHVNRQRNINSDT